MFIFFSGKLRDPLTRGKITLLFIKKINYNIKRLEVNYERKKMDSMELV